MPPTFPIFLGLIAYIGLTGISLILFLPMLFFNSKRAMAMKGIATVVLSFPCLVIVVIVYGLIFSAPALILSKLVDTGNIPKVPGIIIFIIGAVIFLTLVVASSLYLWYFLSKIIYQKIDNKPVSEFLNKERVFNRLRSYSIKY
jgi:hypothetical protein